jgi:hypothetical protein
MAGSGLASGNVAPVGEEMGGEPASKERRQARPALTLLKAGAKIRFVYGVDQDLSLAFLFFLCLRSALVYPRNPG